MLKIVKVFFVKRDTNNKSDTKRTAVISHFLYSLTHNYESHKNKPSCVTFAPLRGGYTDTILKRFVK